MTRVFKTYKAGIKDLPFVLLLNDLFWLVLSTLNIYSFDYWFILEITSHSLFFVFFMLFYAYIHKYCFYSWTCIIGLGFINIINILHYFLNFAYLSTYIAGILIITISLALIYLIKK